MILFIWPGREDDHAREPEPEEEDHHPAERAVGLVVVAEVLDVGRNAKVTIRKTAVPMRLPGVIHSQL